MQFGLSDRKKEKRKKKKEKKGILHSLIALIVVIGDKFVQTNTIVALE